MINDGVGGEYTSDGAQRLPRELAKYRPTLVILCHGGNDLMGDVPAEKIAANVREMVRAAKDKGVDVILVGVPRPGLWLKTAELYGDVAREFGIPYDGKSLTKILSTASLKSDLVHPNEEGYRRLAEAVARLIKDSQASESAHTCRGILERNA